MGGARGSGSPSSAPFGTRSRLRATAAARRSSPCSPTGAPAAGHDVTLFASGDPLTSARLSSVYEQAPSERIGQALPELHHCLACFERADEFDVINDHSGLPAAAIGGLLETPVLHTVHGPLDGEGGRIYGQIAHTAPRLGLVSLSLNQ
jgi:hypothetical protein